MEFIEAFRRNPRGNDAIMVVVDCFSKTAHFVTCHKCDDATYITDLFFQELARIRDIPMTIALDRDTKFLSHFWRCLLRLLRNELLFSITCHNQTNGKIEVAD